MDIFNKDRETENRLRLQKLVDLTTVSDTPTGWTKETFAVGGLIEVGFSKIHPELLLVISSSGRGVIDCSKLKLIDRDDDDDYNSQDLWAIGIGKLSNEKIMISGLHGGGLPYSNEFGDGILYMATQWPIIDLIFEPKFKTIYREGNEKHCFRIFHDYELRAYGFSYDGQYFIIATSSEVYVYRKENNGQ